nr:helix-turn-helix domain-containing protein [Streptococcus minor]
MMDNKEFGQKVRALREEQKITREELCGDETELSVRQLARIELGQNAPTLSKVTYIAQALGVSIGRLTGGEDLELPRRYKELKYQILRAPTYLDEVRLQEREAQFDEIFTDYYDQLPEEERLMVDCIQATMDVALSQNIDFGIGIIQDYFEQVKRKKHLLENDLILLELYFICLIISNFDAKIYNSQNFDNLVENLLEQEKYGDIDNLFLVNKALIKAFGASVRLKKYKKLEEIAVTCRRIMTTTGDFQKMPILNLIEWKYYLYSLNDLPSAEACFENAIKFSQIISDDYLEENLNSEWNKDKKTHK